MSSGTIPPQPWIKRTWYDTGAASGDLCGWSDWTICTHAEALAIDTACELYAAGIGTWPAAQAKQLPKGWTLMAGALVKWAANAPAPATWPARLANLDRAVAQRRGSL